MTSDNVMPRTKTCNELLSLFSKLNRTERAWVLYADMFRLKIKSSVCTFNIMINVLCKEGKLKKAKEFLGFMEILGIKPTVVTYNTIIHGFCLRGRVGGAQMIFGAMKGRGVQPDSYTHGLLISGMCKEKRLDEVSGLFDKMLDIGLLPRAVTYNTLIDGYCNKGTFDVPSKLRVSIFLSRIENMHKLLFWASNFVMDTNKLLSNPKRLTGPVAFFHLVFYFSFLTAALLPSPLSPNPGEHELGTSFLPSQSGDGFGDRNLFGDGVEDGPRLYSCPKRISEPAIEISAHKLVTLGFEFLSSGV
ncbi:putative pentatricopeptide [Rosa chinensis]|uniref:Putative pentatricopeptide n=1 Tax=Rosa chinensis TaxID=74649 RepID=A0A2P6PN21_ROSCH|nr:putative pentatricopeptide [Rosa chinensis]